MVVDAALERLTSVIRSTGAHVSIADNLPELRVDRTWATQAIYNLLSNALKFACQGHAPEVELVAYRQATGPRAGVGIAVRDRGPGVDPRHADRIFELFQRAVGREVEGTGAGLAIVREVALRSGGQVRVQPRDGGGAEFVITFGPAPPVEGEGHDAT